MYPDCYRSLPWILAFSCALHAEPAMTSLNDDLFALYDYSLICHVTVLVLGKPTAFCKMAHARLQLDLLVSCHSLFMFMNAHEQRQL